MEQQTAYVVEAEPNEDEEIQCTFTRKELWDISAALLHYNADGVSWDQAIAALAEKVDGYSDVLLQDG